MKVISIDAAYSVEMDQMYFRVIAEWRYVDLFGIHRSAILQVFSEFDSSEFNKSLLLTEADRYARQHIDQSVRRMMAP